MNLKIASDRVTECPMQKSLAHLLSVSSENIGFEDHDRISELGIVDSDILTFLQTTEVWNL